MKQHFERFNVTTEAIQVIEETIKQLELESNEKEFIGLRLNYNEDEEVVLIELGTKLKEEIPIVFEMGFFTKVTFFVDMATFNYINENNCILDFQDAEFSFIKLEKEFFDEPEKQDDSKETETPEKTDT